MPYLRADIVQRLQEIAQWKGPLDPRVCSRILLHGGLTLDVVNSLGKDDAMHYLRHMSRTVFSHTRAVLASQDALDLADPMSLPGNRPGVDHRHVYRATDTRGTEYALKEFDDERQAQLEFQLAAAVNALPCPYVCKPIQERAAITQCCLGFTLHCRSF